MTFNQLYQHLLQRNGADFGVGQKKFKALLSRLGNPHLDYPIIHVAGTNGKGSVCYLTASVLQEAGYKTGLFISPHLFSPCERISINQKCISQKTFVTLCLKVLQAEEKLNFFEVLTAVAFLYFSHQKVNYVVLETGLGGKKDPTNVCKPIAGMITSIGLDHCALLGDTLLKITQQKAGIIKPSTPIFLGHLPPKVRQKIDKIAQKLKAPVMPSPENLFKIQKIDWENGRFILRKAKEMWSLSTLGEKQVENAGLVYRLCRYLKISAETIRSGFDKVNIPCRFEVVKKGKKTIIFDGAHNLQAAENLVHFFQKSPYCANAALICAFMKDKDYGEMLSIFSTYFNDLYITRLPHRRAASLQEMKKKVVLKGHTVYFSSPQKALQEALKKHEVIVVSGSFYLAALLRTRVGA